MLESDNLLDKIKAGECRCGCKRIAVAGTEVEAAQMVLMRTLAERLGITAALQDERGEMARHLLWTYRRAMLGLEGYVHQDWSNVPIQLGPPTTSYIEFWRRRVLALIETEDPKKPRWWSRKRKKGQAV